MSLSWTAARSAGFRDAYLDWALLLQRRRDSLPPARPDSGPVLEPVFVRLHPGSDPDRARRALRDLVQDPASPLFMDPHEREALSGRIGGGGPEAALPDEYALYRSLGTPDSDHADLFEVLDTGMPVTLEAGGLPATPPAAAAGALPEGIPIMAAIDDGIGFLNTRFCRSDDTGARHTRFQAIWLQALECGSLDSAEVTSGLVLSRDRIDALLAGAREGDTYADLNRQLFGDRSRRETRFASTHGTHVLDLAAGAEPDDSGDPVRNWPLLAVQLPPEAIDDTSGTRFENYMLQGLRWLLRQARMIDRKAPVIVNLSLGVSAGPKDGSRFSEYQMAREARLWEQVTGQPVRLVWAFGNNRRGKQVACFHLDGDDARQTWRVQPDDETASYVELHCRDAGSDRIEVAVTAPDGTCSGFAPLPPGTLRSLERDGSALARLYHVPARDYGTGTICHAHHVIALAPTRGRKQGEPVAPSGAWQIALRRCGGTAAVTVIAQVQRDDAIRGAHLRGRQSYFDGPAAHAWDAEDMAYHAPTPASPITRCGSHSAQVTAPVRQVLSSGAAWRSPCDPGTDAANLRPSLYGGEGADWSVPGPTGATVADEGSFRLGVLAAGTLSGTTRRQNGTSAAAARMSRALGQSAARIRANSSDPDSTQRDDFDDTVLDLVDTRPEDRSRLGEVLIDPRAPTRGGIG